GWVGGPCSAPHRVANLRVRTPGVGVGGEFGEQSRRVAFDAMAEARDRLLLAPPRAKHRWMPDACPAVRLGVRVNCSCGPDRDGFGERAPRLGRGLDYRVEAVGDCAGDVDDAFGGRLNEFE